MSSELVGGRKLLSNSFQAVVTLPGSASTFIALQPKLEDAVSAGIAKVMRIDVGIDRTATGASTTTVIVDSDTTFPWSTDMFTGEVAYIKSGTGSGQWRVISENYVSTLTVDVPFNTAPNGTSNYDIRKASTLQPIITSIELNHTGVAGTLTIQSGGIRNGIYNVRDLWTFSTAATSTHSSAGNMRKIGHRGGDLRCTTTTAMTGTLVINGYWSNEANPFGLSTRESEIADEFVVCDQVRPDANEAPTGYTTQRQPTLVSWGGVKETCPTSYTLNTATPGQGDAFTTLVKSKSDGTYTYTNTLTVSNRAMIVVFWETKITRDSDSAVIYDYSWMSGDLPPETGASIQCNELLRENYLSVLEVRSNPNMGGQGMLSINVGDPPFTYDATRYYGGPPIYQNVDSTDGIVESACYPIEFLPGEDPTRPQHDHGGGDFNPVVYWRFRQYQKIKLFYDGRPNIHTADHWSYCPVEINNTRRQMVHYFSVLYHLVNGLFTAAHVYDVAVGTDRVVTPFADGGDPERYIDRFFCMSGTIDTELSGLQSSDISSGYGAIAVETADGFGVGLICKLQDTDDSDNLQTSILADQPNTLNLRTNTGSGDPDPSLGGHSHVVLQAFSKTVRKRPKGWIGWRVYMYTGFIGDLLSTAQDMYSNGDLDLPAEQSPHASVIAGTGFTGVSGEDTP